MLKALVLVLLVLGLSVSDVLALDFLVSNPVVSGEEIFLDLQMSGVTATNCPDGKCYLQGFLKREGGSKYFGFTMNNVGNWVPYQSSGSLDLDYLKTNFLYCEVLETSCAVTGAKMRFNFDDVNYEGPGSYEIKYGRYTGNSSSVTSYSNVLVVNLEVTTPTPTPTASPTPEPSAAATPSPTPTATPKSTVTPKPVVKATAKATTPPATQVDGQAEEGEEPRTRSLEEGTVQGEESESQLDSPAEQDIQRDEGGFPWVAGGLVLVGLGLVGGGLFPLYKPYLEKYNLRIRGKDKEKV